MVPGSLGLGKKWGAMTPATSPAQWDQPNVLIYSNMCGRSNPPKPARHRAMAAHQKNSRSPCAAIWSRVATWTDRATLCHTSSGPSGDAARPSSSCSSADVTPVSKSIDASRAMAAGPARLTEKRSSSQPAGRITS